MIRMPASMMLQNNCIKKMQVDTKIQGTISESQSDLTFYKPSSEFGIISTTKKFCSDSALTILDTDTKQHHSILTGTIKSSIHDTKNVPQITKEIKEQF